MKRKLTVAISAALLSVACSSSGTVQQNSATSAVAEQRTEQTTGQTQYSQPRNFEQRESVFSMTQIMADPDWIGRSPEGAYWSWDSRSVLFSRKREGSPQRDLFQRPLSAGGNGTQVALNSLHTQAYQNAVPNADRSLKAYLFERNIYVLNTSNGEVRQLTRDTQNKSGLQFLHDGRLSYRVANDFYAINLNSGFTELVLSLQTQEAPKALEEPADILASEEIDLIEYNRVQRRQRQERFDDQQTLAASNASLAPQPIYLGNNVQVVEASLAPSADHAIIAVTEPQSWRGDSDLMPRYVTETGRVENQNVRRRVADAKPIHHTLYLVDISSGEKTELSYESLPGFDEDVLAAVREENYAAEGKTYESKRTPRAIGVMPGWSAPEGNIVWNSSGDAVAVMLRAWDNKDRWITTVDLDAARLDNQHRLHDEAWINRDFNAFNWMPESHSLWYLSEESNYSHLYIKNLNNGNVQQITSGRYLVDNVTLNRAGDTFYFQANAGHPGIYEVFRVPASGGDIEQLTSLNGMTNYSLSPDETRLLLTHSSPLQPNELYVQEVRSGSQATRLTETVTAEFQNMPWAQPEIVEVPSSHVEDPIYSRVYLPKDYDANRAEGYPAVVFIHGAGYLQNAHGGWSGYFREFMYHSKLTDLGYVVLDLDFRGSAGYGRDWRTAVYRQMGTPEVEDLVDVVNWMGAHRNVDVERVGTYGGSYGGFLTFMALFNEPGLFKAGAALRPVTDWAHYNTGYTSNILNLPQDDMIAYRRSSPIYFAEGLEDALLINAPMVDDNVFFQDSVRLVQRLIELEKENFETAIFPVEPHGFVQPSSWLDEYRRIHKLFETNLQ
ncbi:dipeptidyl aminopeptidase/acylaminoacyl peptidase [Idiomarina sp. A28L]|uniref:S9 family peptidase n=1 Tax=Idiomarina sp. A28L TaxID=1036674 RepID=UPI00021387FA|nr:prolyl oligopeptidase family serine peptidase [Idiomarina sp. A28L]EGN75722.1 dipeptidyl aminopeptidase/acylaminoacyl peptidase [Idiomarina sp. A28L]